MFKKTLLVSTMLLMSGVTFANVTSYVGGSLGYSGYQSQTGVNANLFGGYGSVVGVHQNIYLGGELSLLAGHYSNTNMTYGLSLSFLPGVMLSKDTMIYGRVGAAVITGKTRTRTNSTTNLGPQAGIGLQTNVAKNWDIRAEYVRMFDSPANAYQYNLGLVYKFNY